MFTILICMIPKVFTACYLIVSHYDYMRMWDFYNRSWNISRHSTLKMNHVHSKNYVTWPESQGIKACNAGGDEYNLFI